MAQEDESQWADSPAVVGVLPEQSTVIAFGGDVPPDKDHEISLCDTFMSDIDQNNDSVFIDDVDVDKLRELQAPDPDIRKLKNLAVENCED
ncbi:hypothetical protein Pcinc_007787 [Petrolisthes cinctipes]|uniref:Uncharacterized protein n=1 Tax=Petrolisthes cinctipes TaxID=88211 RepID=A0AAE1KY76_PETCI|nr:hypothetical protein Pcinc_007787 [Petrolisthes cinctipes]